jgi:hypothetical protein
MTETRNPVSGSCEQMGHLTGIRISDSVIVLHHDITSRCLGIRRELLSHDVKILLFDNAGAAALLHCAFELRLAHE